MVSVMVERAEGKQSMQVGFTDQQLSAYGGTVLWSGFLEKIGFRSILTGVLPAERKVHNALCICDVALGFMSGVLLGADKLARVAWLSQDVSLPEVLGISRMPSQSTLSRFFARFGPAACEALQGLYTWALRQLPSLKEGYTRWIWIRPLCFMKTASRRA